MSALNEIGTILDVQSNQYARKVKVLFQFATRANQLFTRAAVLYLPAPWKINASPRK